MTASLCSFYCIGLLFTTENRGSMSKQTRSLARLPRYGATFPPKQKRSLGWVPVLTVVLLLFLMWGLTQAEFAHVTVTIGTPPPIINIHLTPIPTHHTSK